MKILFVSLAFISISLVVEISYYALRCEYPKGINFAKQSSPILTGNFRIGLPRRDAPRNDDFKRK